MQHLILDTNGLIIKKRNQCFWIISKKENHRLISPKRLKSIVIIADVLMSTSATHLAVNHEIPIYYANNNGQLYGTLRDKSYKAEEKLRVKQILWSMSIDARKWAQHIYSMKTMHQALSLQKRKIIFKIPEIQLDLNSATFFIELRTIEAGIGKKYWEKFRKQLPGHIEMRSRSERPAKDMVNLLLNYFYGFLYTLVEQAIWANGLNPYIEVVHKQQYQKPVLSFDIIEPFRIVVDEYVLFALSTRLVKPEQFLKKSQGMILSTNAKRILIPLFLQKMQTSVKIDGYTTSWHKHIYREVYKLRQRIEISKTYDEISDYLRYSEQ